MTVTDDLRRHIADATARYKASGDRLFRGQVIGLKLAMALIDAEEQDTEQAATTAS